MISRTFFHTLNFRRFSSSFIQHHLDYNQHLHNPTNPFTFQTFCLFFFPQLRHWERCVLPRVVRQDLPCKSGFRLPRRAADAVSGMRNKKRKLDGLGFNLMATTFPHLACWRQTAPSIVLDPCSHRVQQSLTSLHSLSTPFFTMNTEAVRRRNQHCGSAIRLYCLWWIHKLKLSFVLAHKAWTVAGGFAYHSQCFFHCSCPNFKFLRLHNHLVLHASCSMQTPSSYTQPSHSQRRNLICYAQPPHSLTCSTLP